MYRYDFSSGPHEGALTQRCWVGACDVRDSQSCARTTLRLGRNEVVGES